MTDLFFKIELIISVKEIHSLVIIKMISSFTND